MTAIRSCLTYSFNQPHGAQPTRLMNKTELKRYLAVCLIKAASETGEPITTYELNGFLCPGQLNPNQNSSGINMKKTLVKIGWLCREPGKKHRNGGLSIQGWDVAGSITRREVELASLIVFGHRNRQELWRATGEHDESTLLAFRARVAEFKKLATARLS